VTGFTEEETTRVLTAEIPNLSRHNIEFIGKYYSKLKRCPTYGELRLYGAILDIQRKRARGALISRLGTDSIALMETYNDHKAKAVAMRGKKHASLTLDESAALIGEYMRMIGRYDSRSFAKAPQKHSAENDLTLISDGSAVMTLGAAKVKEKKKKKKRRKGAREVYAVLLLNADTRNSGLRALFADKKVRARCKKAVRIGEFGLIGAISEICEGARADLSKLSEDAPLYSVLTECFTYKYLVLSTVKQAGTLIELAAGYGVEAVYFAVTESGDRLRAMYADIPLELVRILMDSRKAIETCVSECDPSAAYTPKPLYAVKGEKKFEGFEDALLKSRERLVAAVSISPEKNAFGAAVNALVDNTLRLVAAGADRRAICSAAVYEFPCDGRDAESLGESLALILGAYRVGVELAFSEGMTETSYNTERKLTSVLYASAPRNPVSAVFTAEGSYIGFLPIEKSGDGFIDFNSLRRVCDSFYELKLNGKILSARAVTDEPSVTVEKMKKCMTVTLTESGRLAANAPCKGILFETSDGRLDCIIGSIDITERAEPEECEAADAAEQ
jgi:hypothetical protein